MNKLFKLAGVSIVSLSAALYASSVTKTMAEDITKTSDLNGFSKIKMGVSSDVKVTIGNDYAIEMVGDAERIGNTVLEVKGGTLHIKHKRGNFHYDDEQDMMINVIMPNIDEMQLNGSGNVEITDVDNQELNLQVNGSGNLVVSGRTEKLDVNLNGSGDIYMEEVAGDNVDISINGSGDVAFDGGTCQSLDINIHGSGDVEAKDLKCVDVAVDVSGSGDSEVYASNSLTFDSHGSGEVDVYGKPQTVIDNEAKRRSRITIR